MFMKRVLFINGHMKLGGVEKSLLDILKHFDYSKYQVDLLLLEEQGEYINELPENVNIIYKSIEDTYGSLFTSLKKCIINRNFFCFIVRLIFFLRKFIGINAFYLFRLLLRFDEYDCVISFRHGFCSELAAYGIRGRRKILWWHHGEVYFNVGEVRFFEKVFSKFDKIVIVSKPIKKELETCFPNLRDRMLVISNMIDLNTISNKSELFNPYENDKRRIIVSVGRIAPEKHFENVVYATKKLIENHIYDFLWVVVGGEWDFEKIKNLVIEYNLSDYIKMVGNKKNPYPYIKYADLYVHTSYVESQGLSVLEAMSLKCPCVVTKSKGVNSFVKNQVNAVLVEQNVDSLVDGIKMIYNNPILKGSLCKEAYITTQEYLPKKIMIEIEKIINS